MCQTLLEIQLLNVFQALPCKHWLQKNRFGQQCISVQESAVLGINEFLISIQQLREAVFSSVPAVAFDTQRDRRALLRLGKALPVQALAAAVAVRLELPLHGLAALRADGEAEASGCGVETAHLCDGHRDAIRDLLWVGGGRD